MLTLYIGNKNYSSWSMRPWLALTALGIPFQEIQVWFDDFADDQPFKQQMQTLAPTAQVPVLVDGQLSVWDSLAIVEYVAEQHPELALWPQAADDRAHARSLCAQMHSGFGALRSACPMNIEAKLGQVGKQLWQDNRKLRQDVAHITTMWDALLADGRDFLFGDFGIVDAFYAPVVMRLTGYDLPVSASSAAYIKRIQQHPAVAKWVQDALNEHRFVAVDEPYRTAAD